MEFETLDISTDHDRVAALFQAASDYVELESGQPPTNQTVIDFFEERPPTLTADDTHHIGVVKHGRLVGLTGLCFGYPQTFDCYIGMLIFEPAARGQRLGRRTVDHVAAYARSRGANRLLIAVLDANPKGRAFWERNGFVLEQTFPPSDDAHTRHRMIRTL